MSDGRLAKDDKFGNLDNPETFRIDRSDMYSWIEKWEKILKKGIKESFENPELKRINRREYREIIVCGMGGSAIAGDVAFAAVADKIRIPYRIVRGYFSPASMGNETLLIILSYSGSTEEAIWSYAQGHNKGAEVVAISSGGALRDLANRNGRVFVGIPSDAPAPRLALGYLFPAVLAVIERTNPEIDNLEDVLNDSIKTLSAGKKRFERNLPEAKNLAKQIARQMSYVFPVIAGSEYTWPSALRFQTQLNENAKWPSHASQIPELNHNEIVAYSQAGALTSKIGLLLLVDKEDHPRVRIRQDFTSHLVEDSIEWVRSIKGEGKTRLARIINLIQLADYVSYYLACGRGVDPMDITAISSLKQFMGEIDPCVNSIQG